MDKFININFNTENLDIYFIRTSIYSSLKKFLPHAYGEMLDLGCGKMPYKKFILEHSSVQKYIGLDIEDALEYEKDIKPDLSWKGEVIPAKDNSYDCVLATEVLEHCPKPEQVLKEVFRVLKPGGLFFFTVPFLWNLHEVPNDEYRYTPFALQRLLKNAGFSEIELKATGGWHASMAQMLGLWVRRSPMKANKRKLLSILLKPVIKKLINLDKLGQVQFKDGQMITGLYGIAKK